MKPKALVLALGNELLIGRTVNTNATVISLELTKIGVSIEKHIVIPDHEETIVKTMKNVLQDEIEIIVITGGLGPTHDDIQLECLAKALNRPLVQDKTALKMIKINDSLPPARIKLSYLPEGSQALSNSVGVAPGIFTTYNSKYIFSLPGVPSEMKAILKEEIIPRIKKLFILQPLIEYGFNAYNIRESQTLEIIRSVRKQFPNLFYKTHPKKDNNTPWLAIHIYGEEEEDILQAINQIHEALSKIETGKLTKIQHVFEESFEIELN